MHICLTSFFIFFFSDGLKREREKKKLIPLFFFRFLLHRFSVTRSTLEKCSGSTQSRSQRPSFFFFTIIILLYVVISLLLSFLLVFAFILAVVLVVSTP